MENDFSCLNTDDVTIEIDNDVAKEVSAKDLAIKKIGPWIRPPLRIEDVRLCSVDKLRICNLSNEAVALLSSHLNMPSYGSLKNWDSIGIHLKIPDHEIMGDNLSLQCTNNSVRTQSLMNREEYSKDVLSTKEVDKLKDIAPESGRMKREVFGMNGYRSLRNDPRPMDAILNKCRNSPVNDLIRALQTCKRIDILYSLKILEQKGKLTKSSQQNVGINSASTLVLSSTDKFELCDTDSIRTILLIHYEESVEETRDYKWLCKNLLKHATQYGFRIVDINTLDVDANIIASVENAFTKAHQIVVSFTPSHIEAVKSRNTACRSIIYAHDLMNQEFFTLNSTNRRFRAVVFNDTQASSLPLGWPRSTLVYHFPTNMNALCTKIFKGYDNGLSTL
ncbi:hypothetical protein DICVIV_08766 [Dictyocaulus viviparus]|uniref:Uncharacterized protein n=1 Tax=Dictyocaulus viviparus TaxID=29172 RepID=A0A0D8XS51_DICVI|nr:hypothetical protein DICVIV_08766 [Dictyocaulus viviparus]